MYAHLTVINMPKTPELLRAPPLDPRWALTLDSAPIYAPLFLIVNMSAPPPPPPTLKERSGALHVKAG